MHNFDLGPELIARESDFTVSTEHEERLLQELTEADDTIAELHADRAKLEAELAKHKSYVANLQQILHEFLSNRTPTGDRPIGAHG